jgi:hypothetical protein
MNIAVLTGIASSRNEENARLRSSNHGVLHPRACSTSPGIVTGHDVETMTTL